MHPRSLSPRKLIPLLLILAVLASACGRAPTAAPPQPALTQAGASEALESFSSDALGICFSYPQGYTQLPSSSTVEIVPSDQANPESRAIFWLETSDAYGRTVEQIADQESTSAAGLSFDRLALTLGGEPAVMLDGMPGQDLQRRVYAVHGGTLYVLAFMPTRSPNQATADQLEALYAAITNSWAWAACPAGQ